MKYLLACLLVPALMLFGGLNCQEIKIQRPVYSVPENVSLDNLVLRVCVEGLNLDDQAYSVQLQTEQATAANSATDGLDYIGISKELVLTGPGEHSRCTCIEVLDDELIDNIQERFGLRLSGSPLITRDFVDVFIEDDEGAPFLSLAFINDTPRVDGNQVTFELQFDSSLTSITCEVVDQASVDCSGSGTAVLTLPESNIRPFQPKITTVNSLGIEEVFEDPNRVFRISNSGRCSVHLINEGISYNPVTGDTTFQWVWTGPGEEGRTFCVVDSGRPERCISPYTVSGLTDGAHSMTIRVRRGVCTRGRARPVINFNIPL